MKKRLMALVLVMVLVFSMTACGSKSTKSSKGESGKKETVKSVAEVCQAVEEVVEKGNLKSVKITASTGDYSVEINSFTDVKEKKVACDVSVNGKAATDIIFVDDTLYINAKDAAKWIDSNEIPGYDLKSMLDGVTVSELLTQYGITTDYVKVSADVASEVAGGYAESSMGVDTDGVSDLLEGKTYSEKDAAELIGALAKVVASVESDETVKDAVSFDGQMCTLTITNENYEKLFEALKKADLTELAAAYEKLTGEELDVDDLKEQFEESLDEAKDKFEETVEDGESFKEVVKFGANGENLEVSVDATMGEAKSKFSVKTGTKSKTISAPKDAFDLEELAALME